ncbi:LysR family transcriptional regulator [Streptomyces sp. NPDC050418]|uniref:LysR family transcriptional regulator n=1 Tax=Streptomyces sp. NPDC050418 TaxID=3365612 RepID=UPI003794D281
MDLAGVRTFAAVAATGRFQDAALELAVTQQAVSKRIAALEKELGVRLFARTTRGAQLTVDGRAFLPHARELLRAAERAVASVQPGRRALRVDVIARRIAPAQLLREFHRTHPRAELDVVTLSDADEAIEAVRTGAVDASFRAVVAPPDRLPDSIRTVRVLDEPHMLLTGPGHALADAAAVTPAELAGQRIWMPGLVEGAEWTAYYDELAADFGLSIDAIGPNFGTEALLEAIADSTGLTTLLGEGTRLVWPTDYDLRRIPVRGPSPVYPHSLIWHADNPHPALTALREFLPGVERGAGREVWVPSWAV